jgi:hypothetical protein
MIKKYFLSPHRLLQFLPGRRIAQHLGSVGIPLHHLPAFIPCQGLDLKVR